MADSDREKRRYEGEMKVFKEKKAKDDAAAALLAGDAGVKVGKKRPATAPVKGVAPSDSKKVII